MVNSQPLWFRRSPVRITLYLSLWTCLGLLNVSQTYYFYWMSGRPFDLIDALVVGLADWYIWAALAPFVVLLGRRFPLEQKRWILHIPLHLVFSILGAMITTVLFYPVMICTKSVLEPQASILTRLEYLFMREVHLYLWVYWAVLGIGHALDYYRRYREREVSAAHLQAQLAQAQLRVLKMQLDPHFLFNTLHAVTALVHRRPDLAETVITRLSEMLRMSLDSHETQEVPLRDELRFLEPYLEIQRIRFEGRLEVVTNIDPKAAECLVPNLILQPLVENAIRHGIEPRAGAGRIRIEAERNGRLVWLRVSDNGAGIAAGKQAAPYEGVGLTNTRSRLHHLYGSEFRFEISNGPAGGAVIALGIPWHATSSDFTATEAQRRHEDPDADSR